MSEEWLEALAPLGTDWRKPFLQTAPWLVVCFAERYQVDDDVPDLERKPFSNIVQGNR
jgi:hypothetical protein